MIQVHAEKKLGGFSLAADIADDGFICLAGRNGSGKSSLFRIISGTLGMDRGFVKVGGTDVTRLPVERRGIVMVTPASSIPHLDVEKHLRWGASIGGRELDPNRIASVKSALGIDYGGRVRTLSLGMRERVSLATALLASPRLILVDEAFANLHDQAAFVAAYRGLASDAGADVIFSTQDQSDRVSDHLYLMDAGATQRVR